MATDALAQTVAAILARQAVLDPADVTPDRTLADLGIDSLGLFETLFALEETFDITIPFDAGDPEAAAQALGTVGALTGAVRALVAARP